MMKFILLKTAIIMTLIICFATSLKLAYDGSTFRHRKRTEMCPNRKEKLRYKNSTLIFHPITN